MNPLRRKNAAYMQKQEPVPNGSVDWWLAGAVGVLLCIGLIMVFSASGVQAERLYSDKYFYFRKQCLFVFLGIIVLLITSNIPRKLLYKLQYPFLFIVIFLLLLTLLPIGHKVKGSSRWLSLGPLSIQPLEFSKIALSLYLAYFLSNKRETLKTFTRGLLPPLLITILMAGILILQPDFGGAMMLFFIFITMLWIGGVNFIQFFCVIGTCVALAIGLAMFEPYRVRRLTAFMDPFKDPQGAGYQLVQSLYALGSGGFFGSGLGGSTQKMQYLPEAHNDFILAVLGEELGFIGISCVMLLFTIVFCRCASIIMNQEQLQDKLSAFGVTMVLVIGTILNIAVVVGFAPPKGVALPFLSYGGSNMLTSMFCVGLRMNFSRNMGRV